MKRPAPAPDPSPRRWWTPERLAELHDLTERGYSDREIGAHFGRSAEAMEYARTTYGCPRARDVRRPATMQGIAERLGVTAMRVYRWVEHGWLTGRVLSVGTKTRRFIDEDALFRFLRNPAYWGRWEPAAIPDLALREWCQELRAARPVLSVAEAATRLGVEAGVVRRYIREGRLPVHGTPPGLRLPAAAVAAFVPPCHRPQNRVPHRPWTLDELRRLRLWRRRGAKQKDVARWLGRPVVSVSKRDRELRELRAQGDDLMLTSRNLKILLSYSHGALSINEARAAIGVRTDGEVHRLIREASALGVQTARRELARLAEKEGVA